MNASYMSISEHAQVFFIVFICARMNISSQISACECRSACVNSSYMCVNERAKVFLVLCICVSVERAGGEQYLSE